MADKAKRNLVHPLGDLIPFDNDHADRIMAMPDHLRGGWEEEPKKKKSGGRGSKATKANAVNNDANKGDTRRESDAEPATDPESD